MLDLVIFSEIFWDKSLAVSACTFFCNAQNGTSVIVSIKPVASNVVVCLFIEKVWVYVASIVIAIESLSKVSDLPSISASINGSGIYRVRIMQIA